MEFNPVPESELNVQLGQYIADIAESAISSNGVFVFATSGGSMPVNLHAALESAAESGRVLDMSKWHIFYADDRYVGLEDPDSNHAGTASALAPLEGIKNVIGKPVYHTIKSELPLDECAAEYQDQVVTTIVARVAKADVKLYDGTALSEIPGAPDTIPQFDLVLLGLGPDGHTCSLFPDHALLHENVRLVAPISDSPKPPSARVTLTFPVINAAKNVAFIALSSTKVEIIGDIHKAILTDSRSNSMLPAGRARQFDGTFPKWFVDPEAVAFNH